MLFKEYLSDLSVLTVWFALVTFARVCSTAESSAALELTWFGLPLRFEESIVHNKWRKSDGKQDESELSNTMARQRIFAQSDDANIFIQLDLVPLIIQVTLGLTNVVRFLRSKWMRLPTFKSDTFFNILGLETAAVNSILLPLNRVQNICTSEEIIS